MSKAIDTLESITEKKEQQTEPRAQLERQLLVERKFGIKAHEISKILLKPNGRSRITGVTYSSVVTMKNGDEIFVVNVNIKKLLDEGAAQ
jgi:hypothetical protein